MRPGTVIADRYQLLRPLGSGGTAHVWAALDLSLNREVAVKILSGTSAGPAERERLRREARVLATLDHQRVTTVFDFVDVTDHTGTVTPVLVTELLDGVSLDERLQSGPLEPGQAVQVCAQLADALAAAHRAGIAHRDVKPGNVMLTSRGVKLLDFGIARSQADTQLTGSMVIGTPVCMAPEQWSGRGAQPASDVYALGCVLYWCLAGHAPYPYADLAALGMAHLQADPPMLPAAVPEAVADLYLACMAKDPAHRPSAEQAYTVLATGRSAAPSGPAGATQVMSPLNRTAPIAPIGTPGTGHRGAGAERRRIAPALMVAGGAVLVLVVVLALIMTHGNTPSASASGSGAGSSAPTTSASPSVDTIVMPSNTVTTATSTSATPTPSATTASTSPDSPTAALATLQTIAGQLKTLNKDQSRPDPAYQDLLNRVDDIEQSVRNDEQNTARTPTTTSRARSPRSTSSSSRTPRTSRSATPPRNGSAARCSGSLRICPRATDASARGSAGPAVRKGGFGG